MRIALPALLLALTACGDVLTEPDAGTEPDATTCPDGDDDADGVCNSADACAGDDASGDTDDDGVCDDTDACAGDDSTGDDDSDELCDDTDPCPGDAGNDPDSDGVCAASDVCTGNDATGDTDGDGVCDDTDACRGDDGTGDPDTDQICSDVDPCDDDTSNSCAAACVIAFDDQWFLTGDQTNPNTYYSTYGVGFDNTAGYGLIGGMGNGDPGNWDIEGSNGSAAWGIWPGAHAITFTEPAVEVSLDFLRAFDDYTIEVHGFLDGVRYETVTVSLVGAFNVQTATFAGAVDEIRWDFSGYFGVDNLRYRTTAGCPPAVSFCRAWFDDARAALGDGANPDTYYSPYGLRFDNAAGYGLIGGEDNGDPGNWNIQGSFGTDAWGLWPGAHDIRWETYKAMGVKVDFLRGHNDYSIPIQGLRDGSVVQGFTMALAGAYNTQTASFTVPIDRIAWNFSGYYGVDNIRYMTYGTCPPAP